MNTEEPAQPRRRPFLEPIGADMLLPRGTTNLPPQVAQANELAWQRYEQWLEARRRASEAHHVARAAPRHDRLALEAALAADEKPPKETLPAKRAKAEAARREADAIENVAKLAVLDLYDAVGANYEEFLAGREAAFDAVADRPRQFVQEVIESWADVEREGSLLARAREWRKRKSIQASLSSTGRTAHDRLAKAEQAQESRRLHRRNPDVPDVFEDLAVALRRRIEEQAKP
jgi:hypothetical protein